MTTLARRLTSAWSRFFFTPRPTSTLALFRIAFGLVVTLWTLSFAPLLTSFFGDGAAIPDRESRGTAEWSIFTVTVTGTSFGAALVVWLVLLAGSLALTVGYQTRLASVVVFVGALSILRQTPYAANSGDGLIRVLAFYLVLSPAGAALSVDRWRADRQHFWEHPERAPWALRLMQIQLSLVYLTTVWDKVQGDTWRNGTATSFSLRLLEVQRAPSPSLVTDSLAVTQVMTLGTLALELLIGFFVWNRTTRPWLLSLGVLFHLSIEVSVTVGFFSLVMFALYVTFVPPERATATIEAARAHLERRRRGAGGSAVVPQDRAQEQGDHDQPRPDVTHEPVFDREDAGSPRWVPGRQ